jgi:hypothetical protein
MLKEDPTGRRTGQVMRQSFDQLYDGGRTGVYHVDQLSATQKTHLGTFVEVNMAKEFNFETVGVKFDYRIAGHDVDAKFSLSGGWMLPPEVVGHLCLVMQASDEEAWFDIGVVRASADWLTAGGNRDKKVALRAGHRDKIAWIHRGAPMPPNVLANLPKPDLDVILSRKSGQQKVNEIFRRAPGRRISRAAIETLAMQRDPMKRVRRNGGARTPLAKEGIIIMGGDYIWQRNIVTALEVEPPLEGEFVSLYLTLAEDSWDGPKIVIEGQAWRLGTPAEAQASASQLPEVLQEAGKTVPQPQEPS